MLAHGFDELNVLQVGKSIIYMECAFDKACDAFEFMQSGRSVGKTLLEMRDSEDPVEVEGDEAAQGCCRALLRTEASGSTRRCSQEGQHRTARCARWWSRWWSCAGKFASVGSTYCDE